MSKRKVRLFWIGGLSGLVLGILFPVMVFAASFSNAGGDFVWYSWLTISAFQAGSGYVHVQSVDTWTGNANGVLVGVNNSGDSNVVFTGPGETYNFALPRNTNYAVVGQASGTFDYEYAYFNGYTY